jgi:tRNA pseudouridine55 synthase
MHGWLLIDKPAGPTSAAMVAQAKRALDARKAGHAGTLDPAATGLLAIAFGEATKTVPYVADAEKTYRFTLRWGAATDTDDAEGAVIATSSNRPDEAAVRAALPAFTGDILQIPPQVSAVKVAGQRAYDLARAGVAPELAPRPLRVSRLELVAIDRDTALFQMTCGKGGYVRSLGRDLGRRLGCLAHVASLRRLRAGPFDVTDAIDPARLDTYPDALLLPLTAALAGLPELAATAEGAARLLHGNPGEVIGDLAWGAEAWASRDGRPLAIGRYRGGLLHPARVFALG